MLHQMNKKECGLLSRTLLNYSVMLHNSHFTRANFTLQPVTQPVCSNIEVILGLQTEPKLWRISEVSRQAQGGICRDTALSQNNLINPARINANFKREPVLAQIQRLEKFFKQYFPWVDRM
jgi:hypothetical protein